jgi:hypothetical protein
MNELDRLRRIVDPLGLCRYVGKRLNYSTENCDHTFKHTSVFLAPYARRAGLELETVLDLLRAMGATCDCELGLNICGRWVKGA